MQAPPCQLDKSETCERRIWLSPPYPGYRKQAGRQPGAVRYVPMKPLILTRQPGSKSQPVVRKAVNQLRRECIQRDPGTLLGQEEELLRRLGVSRPTLRQAAALLGQEQLMDVRRGPGGGYFTTRPDISAVVHMAAIWLQLEHVAIGEILASTSALRRELAPLAALNMDEEGYD